MSDDVWVIAPEHDQSGVSHSLSLNDPLRLRQVGERHYAVKGTPTDCVIMGARHVLHDHQPDLVLSGVNRGRNAAEDVLYSGTIAAAKEACVLGIPSFALSQAHSAGNKQNPFWQTAVEHAPAIIDRVLKQGIPRDVLVNVNFPDCPPGAVKGVSVSAQGKRDQQLLHIDARHDGRGNPYYWIAYARGVKPTGKDGTDLAALFDNRIAVTPLRLDLTDQPFLTKLAELFPITYEVERAADESVQRMEFMLTLRRRGIGDQAVLRAMDEVPREHFVETRYVDAAYADHAMPIACGQTISQPYVVAYMTEQLQVKPNHRVLEVGTGSGYQAAVLSRLAREVFSIERFRTLADAARTRLKTLGYNNVEVLFGDGFAGNLSHAPYDRIIVTAAADTVPQPLVQQLAEGGIMILPLGPQQGAQHLVRVIKTAAGIEQETLIARAFRAAPAGKGEGALSELWRG